MSPKEPVSNQRGQGNTEYVVITILVALIVLFAVQRYAGALRNRFGNTVGTVSSVNVLDTANQGIQGEPAGVENSATFNQDTLLDGTQPAIIAGAAGN